MLGAGHERRARILRGRKQREPLDAFRTNAPLTSIGWRALHATDRSAQHGGRLANLLRNRYWKWFDGPRTLDREVHRDPGLPDLDDAGFRMPDDARVSRA